jgi:hypothetical protein
MFLDFLVMVSHTPSGIDNNKNKKTLMYSESLKG